MNRFTPAALLALLAACGPAGNDPGPGGVTVDEAQALDDAAEMLDQRRLPDTALPPAAGQNAAPGAATASPSAPPSAPPQ